VSDPFLDTLLDAAAAAYRPAGRFAYHFARAKLGGDPVFRGVLGQGLIPDGARILDLGCGRAVLAAWLLAARRVHDDGRWASGWPVPPRIARLRGIELMPRDVARAHAALAALGRQAALVAVEQGDIRTSDFGRADVVTLLDVLHYLDFPAQEDVLRRVRAALVPGGRLIARIGDADAGLPFRISNWVDRGVTLVRGHPLPRLYCRPRDQWTGLLEGLGFAVRSQPMGEGKSFANVLLVAQLPGAGTGI
jgi:SAM-dependent methyltransferase